MDKQLYDGGGVATGDRRGKHRVVALPCVADADIRRSWRVIYFSMPSGEEIDLGCLVCGCWMMLGTILPGMIS